MKDDTDCHENAEVYLAQKTQRIASGHRIDIPRHGEQNKRMDVPQPAADEQHRTIVSQHMTLLVVFHFLFVFICLAEIGILFLLYLSVQDFIYVLLCMAAFFLCSAVLNLISAFRLTDRNSRTFSLAVAGLNCVNWPFGTVLGIATIVVLRREQVMALY